VTRNGRVDLVDVLLIMAHLGTHDSRYDVDGDGRVDFGDVLAALAQLGDRCHR
jgi:hypothetical protein